MRITLSILLLSLVLNSPAQSYFSYPLGNPNSIGVQALGGVCLMGGATENDEAMKWFLQRANGGDVLVLRASGGNGYNSYFYSELGVTINRVETIVFNNASASSEAYIHQRIQEAEAIWFAGGNQWNYVNYWRDTPIATLINEAIAQRNIVVGGTSAGMAILGGGYYTAQAGSVTSATALTNPYHPWVTVDIAPFLEVPFMSEVVTDTHYDNPDRRGRHMVFLARMFADHGIDAKGIACDEYTAVCVSPDGVGRVFGEFPTYQDFAYFLQINCEEPDGPETIASGTPLTWDRGGQGVKVYKVPGTMDGSNTFDLNDWRTGSGGTWRHFRAINGVFSELAGTQAPECAAVPMPGLALKAMLQGPYDPGTGRMRDDLRVAGLIPEEEPYTALGFTHVGGGGETLDAALLGATGDDAIVDWVVVELRDPDVPATVVHTIGALVQRDGDVVDAEGNTPLMLDVPVGEYHVALRHRNHLGVMTAAPLTLGAVTAVVDLTQPITNTYGTEAMRETGGVMLLWCGDVNFDGKLQYTGGGNDRDPILSTIGGPVPTNTVSGYLPADVDLDGVASYTGIGNDRDPILSNIGGSVPTAIRHAQLP
ncbi:MAG: cyanophycinase [Flavobacteriales bacterium]|nr:cyanophycinase [Flavobacteriales bacterium]